jgi:hypothetical protein
LFGVTKQAEQERAREANRDALSTLRFDLLLFAEPARLQVDLLVERIQPTGRRGRVGSRLREAFNLAPQRLHFGAERRVLLIQLFESPDDRVERPWRLRVNGRRRHDDRRRQQRDNMNTSHGESCKLDGH